MGAAVRVAIYEKRKKNPAARTTRTASKQSPKRGYGHCRTTSVYIGNVGSWKKNIGFEAVESISGLEDKGNTAVLMAVDGKLEAIFAIAIP